MDTNAERPIAAGDFGGVVDDALSTTPFVDVHTHLFDPAFGSLALSGIDDLLTYHYLEAELFRVSPVGPEQYWPLSKQQRADLVWQTLFVENTPISEASRGVVAVLTAFGLDATVTSLEPLRDFFCDRQTKEHLPRVLRLAGISDVVMTNDPMDVEEAALWNGGAEPGAGFHAAIRLDRLLNQWEEHRPVLAAQGYAVESDITRRTLAEVRRFLAGWTARMKPVYLAVSLPPSFAFPLDDARTRLLTGAVLPACRELDVPLALMIGPRRQVNPALRAAGDGVGRADLRALENLCADFPDNRFLVSVLSRENQHELCVCARKFSNLLPFGCWWFVSSASIVEEITRERLEMLGSSFIPQHSDARVLEQLVYKWRNARRTMAPILARTYQLLAEDGRPVTRADIRREVRQLFRGNFEQWTRRPMADRGRVRAG